MRQISNIWEKSLTNQNSLGFPHKILMLKPEGMRTLERPRRIWEDNIKMDLQEVGCEDMD
jgi:hypothetical protein